MLHTTQIADDMLLYDVIESRTRLIYFSYGVCFHDISILQYAGGEVAFSDETLTLTLRE